MTSSLGSGHFENDTENLSMTCITFTFYITLNPGQHSGVLLKSISLEKKCNIDIAKIRKIIDFNHKIKKSLELRLVRISHLLIFPDLNVDTSRREKVERTIPDDFAGGDFLQSKNTC